MGSRGETHGFFIGLYLSADKFDVCGLFEIPRLRERNIESRRVVGVREGLCFSRQRRKREFFNRYMTPDPPGVASPSPPSPWARQTKTESQRILRVHRGLPPDEGSRLAERVQFGMSPSTISVPNTEVGLMLAARVQFGQAGRFQREEGRRNLSGVREGDVRAITTRYASFRVPWPGRS